MTVAVVNVVNAVNAVNRGAIDPAQPAPRPLLPGRGLAYYPVHSVGSAVS